MDNDRKIQPVAKAEVAKNPRPGSMLKKFIVGNAKDVGRSVFNNVLLPSLKSTVETVGISLIKGFLNGDPTQTSVTQTGRISSVSYNRISEQNSDRRYSSPSYSYKSVYDYNDLEFITTTDDKGNVMPGSIKAQDVLNGMRETALEYGWCRVRDIYDLADIHTIGSANDMKFGWNAEMLTPDKARVVSGNNGVFYLDLPKPVVIDR